MNAVTETLYNVLFTGFLILVSFVVGVTGMQEKYAKENKGEYVIIDKPTGATKFIFKDRTK